MIEVFLIVTLSVCVGSLLYQNLKLKNRILNLEFDKFMKNINKEMTCENKDDTEIKVIERTLQ